MLHAMIYVDEYKPSHRRAQGHIRKTHLLGLVPIFIAGMMVSVKGLGASPGLWAAAGLTLGMELMLWSAAALPRYPRGRSKWGTNLAARADDWFPSLMFFIQGGLTAITLLILWHSIIELGFHTILPQNILLGIILFVIPFRRHLRYRQMEEPDDARLFRLETLQYFHICMIAIFLATTLHVMMFPKGMMSSTEPPFGAIAIWTPAILVNLGCFILFLDRIFKKTSQNRIFAPKSDSF